MSSTPKRGAKSAKRPHAGPAALLSTGRGRGKAAAGSAPSTAHATPARALGEDEPAFPQTHYWRAVAYSSATPALNEHEMRALSDIAEHFIVPLSFDVDKHTFGPLAGMSRERRLLNAYYAALLKPKRAGGALPPVCCRDCGGAHVPDDCTAVFAARAEA